MVLIQGSDGSWVGRKLLRRLGGMSDALSIAANLGFSVAPPPPSQGEYADMTWEEFRKNKLGAAKHCSATKKGNHKLTIREGLMIYMRVDHYSQKIRPICYQFMDHLANIKE
ncbi:putative cathepsin H [Helianthus debilis subsp. tardiflorus]